MVIASHVSMLCVRNCGCSWLDYGVVGARGNCVGGVVRDIGVRLLVIRVRVVRSISSCATFAGTGWWLLLLYFPF